METIAENKTTVTQELFFDALAAADNYRSTVMKGMGFLAALWLVLLAVTVFLGMPIGMAVMELAVIGAVGVWLLVIYPRNRSKSAFHAMQRKFNGDMDRSIRFYTDRLEIETAEACTEFTYHEMIRITQTKKVMILTTADKTGIFFALDGFTKGDAQTVRKAVEAIIL